MNELPRQKLREMIAEYGRSVCENPAHCKGLLLDLCGDYKREVNVLVAVLEEHVVDELMHISGGVPAELVLARLTQRLCDNRGMEKEAARWGVESWALALGISVSQAGTAPTVLPQTAAVSTLPVQKPTTQEVTASAHSSAQTFYKPVEGREINETSYRPIAGMVVDFDTNQLAQGKALTIFYHGFLSSSSHVYLHWGKNGWQDVPTVDEPMVKRADGFWQTRITIPIDATQINLAFHDESGRRDNNSGNNWNFAIRAAKSNLQEAPSPRREQEKATPPTSTPTAQAAQPTSQPTYKKQGVRPILAVLSVAVVVPNAVLFVWLLKTLQVFDTSFFFLLGVILSFFMGILAAIPLIKEPDETQGCLCLISGLVASVADVIILFTLGFHFSNDPLSNIGLAILFVFLTGFAWVVPIAFYSGNIRPELGKK
jgi:hypothetical protein